MDIEIGSEIEIVQALNFPPQTVTVTGIRLWCNESTVKAIITITDSDGDDSTVGAMQLAQWVEKAAAQYRN